MKVLCSACEAAEARVLCCADEAALCATCDRDVHAANRLAGKHQRLPLLTPGSSAPVPPPPKCDICQESHAYFFCLEDRALLCRSCDIAVHTINALVSTHRRFLLTGVQVSQEQDDCSSDPPEPSPPPAAKSDPDPLYGEGDFGWAAAAPTPDDAGVNGSLPDWSAVNEQFSSPAPPPRHAEAASRSPRAPAFSGQGGMMDWPLGEFFGGFSNFNGGFGFGESGTSKLTAGSSEAALAARRTTCPHRRTGTTTSSSNRCPRCSGRRRSSPPRRRPPASTGRGARQLTAAVTAATLCQTSAPQTTPSVTASRPASRPPQSARGNASNVEKTRK